MALINFGRTVKSLYKAVNIFNKLKEDPSEKNVELNIPFNIYYKIIGDILLIVFLIMYWKN
jgi:hypothetical protein